MKPPLLISFVFYIPKRIATSEGVMILNPITRKVQVRRSISQTAVFGNKRNQCMELVFVNNVHITQYYCVIYL